MTRRHRETSKEEWLSIHEACELIGVSPATLRRWNAAGTVDAFMTPGGHRRFARSVILSMLPAPHQNQVPISVNRDSAGVYESVNTSLDFRMLFLRELRQTAKCLGLTTSEATQLIEIATQAIDHLLMASVSGYEEQSEQIETTSIAQQ